MQAETKTQATCARCAGTGVVSDGVITGSGGVQYENGPVVCIKDCPDCTGRAASPLPAALPASGWRDLSTAPKDGTVVRLLVNFTDNQLTDSDEPQATIGGNTFRNTGEDDKWLFAGWCWEQDRFTQGEGKAIAWMPLLDTSTTAAAPADLIEAVDDVLERAPCDCSHKRRYEDGEHLSGCHLFDLNLARSSMVVAAAAPTDAKGEALLAVAEFIKSRRQELGDVSPEMQQVETQVLTALASAQAVPPVAPTNVIRKALQSFLDHAAGQGWWLEPHAIKVMDDARAALKGNAS